IENLPGVGDHKCSDALGTGPQNLQLLRQCTAAALNIQATLDAQGDCRAQPSLDPHRTIGDVYDACCNNSQGPEDFCKGAVPPLMGGPTIGQCIDLLDAFNNSDFGGNELAIPSTFPSSQDFGRGYFPPGPADSATCQEANGNGFTNFDVNATCPTHGKH